MSDDGADMGVMPERALKTVLGGKAQPGDDEKLDAQEFERKVREAPLVDVDSYDGASTACARVILEAIERYPELRQLSYEATYLRGGDGQMVVAADGGGVVLQPGLYDALKRLYPDDGPEAAVFLELTGFMWGWACNAVQNILGEPPVPNPAIVEIG